MASRSKHSSRSDRDSDSMEALKPLVVLVLFGTILYGAYSVVQKGPSNPTDDPAAQANVAPAFAPPAVDLAPAAPVAAVPLAAAPVLPPAAPPPAVAPLSSAANEPTTTGMPPTPIMPPTPVMPAPPHTPEPPPTMAAQPPVATPLQTAAIAAAAAGAGAAIGGSAIAEPARMSPAAPTYLTAESAPPPLHAPAATVIPDPVPPGNSIDRPDRFASLSTAAPPATAVLPPAAFTPPSSAATSSSAAFATAWADAHEKLAAGRYAEALAALSVWYDDPSLGLEESQRLEDLLGQLAGTVIYSPQDLLLPPHVVAAGETLPLIAAPLGVSWQLLGKINGIADPRQLAPGEHVKVVRGPFDAVVSVSRRRLSLQLGGNYAGSFPVVIGRQFLGRVGGSVPVVDVRRGHGHDVQAVAATGLDPTSTKPSILLGEGLVIEAAEDPNVVSDNSPATSLVVSVRDLEELLDILGPGTRVLVRQ